MYPEYPNLYQRARKATYFSQEEAAELLGLSAESMKQYESGRRTPSDDTVHRMAELYNLPWLELEHAKATDRLGVLPDVHIQPLPTASIMIASAASRKSGARRMTSISRRCRALRSQTSTRRGLTGQRAAISGTTSFTRLQSATRRSNN